MNVNYGEHIRKTVLENLLVAHRVASKTGNVNALVMLSKLILKISKQFNNKMLDLRFEKSEQYTHKPPDESEDNITEFK